MTLENSSSEIYHILNKHLLISITDLDGVIVYVSKGLLEATGYKIEELKGQNQSIFGHNREQNIQIEKLWENIKHDKSWHGELENTTKNGDVFWVDAIVEPLFDKSGIKYGYIALKHNITDKKHNELLSKVDPLTQLFNRRHLDNVIKNELEKARFLNSTIGLLIIDIDHFKDFNDCYGHPKGDEAIVYVAETLQLIASRNQGYAFRLGGEEFAILVPAIQMNKFDFILRDIHKRIKELQIVHDASKVSKQLTVSIGAVLADMTGKEAIGSCPQKLYVRADLLLYQAKKEGRNRSCFEYIVQPNISKKSDLDELTKLPTRQHLNQRILNNQKEKMIILIQINHYEYIKTQYGIAILNDVLLQKSKTYRQIIQTKEDAYLFRLNVNEFAILVEDATLFENYILKAKHYILEQTFCKIESEKKDIVVSQIIGVAISHECLLSRADTALKKANDLNQNFCLYDSKMLEADKSMDFSFKNISLYKNALEDNRIVPFFQPIVYAKTEKIYKYEALARIITEDNTILLPQDFIKHAKEDRTYEYFTRQMLQKIFRIYKNNKNLSLSVNLSYASIESEETCFYVKNRLEQYGGEKITFEIIESEEIKDYSCLLNFIEMVKQYGATIAIDDFGTGYSNLAHLMRLSPDFLKIDGSLIKTLHTDKKIENIIKSLVLYTQKTNSKLIAEYVSNEEIAKKASKIGVEYLQGYYYGEPKPADFYGLNGF